MLVLNEDIKNQIIKHAIHELPNEACGLFCKHRFKYYCLFYPMENVAKSEIIYQLDPLEMMKVEGIADAERGKSLE